METAELILKELKELRVRQEATFADLAARLDAIDRQTDIPLTTRQAAVFLGCSVSSVKLYAQKGIIKKQVRKGLAGYLRQDLEKLKRK